MTFRLHFATLPKFQNVQFPFNPFRDLVYPQSALHKFRLSIYHHHVLDHRGIFKPSAPLLHLQWEGPPATSATDSLQIARNTDFISPLSIQHGPCTALPPSSALSRRGRGLSLVNHIFSSYLHSLLSDFVQVAWMLRGEG